MLLACIVHIQIHMLSSCTYVTLLQSRHSNAFHDHKHACSRAAAFSFAFSVGSVAKAGTFDKIEKEAKLEANDSDASIKNRLKVSVYVRE